ncbi:MAG: hypothetical protein A3H71_03250 [Candidatus Sungbacteria bacterium RIFCSPLOWO2_02_FULL_48_13b]|uniref:Peptidase S9 prolyl oligopeptidase catalytic domain-containing protein n=1 Tax=Candidatus Sungbacteria bacterium RIFCSPLOWO2_02_FULL_48_13b TaxID=1802283 RepID=A0A1G2LHG1_9BACT|nr:MAG: hypothetical protein A3H71_03250 [Candidatus Sungbacteria bacterium RIFCSPLOWO2_02_FULL_48_13b]
MFGVKKSAPDPVTLPLPLTPLPFEDGEKYNAFRDLQSCKKPKLFFYGTEDVMVVPEAVKKAYQVAAEPKMIHELNSEHDYRLHPEIIEEVNKVVGLFLDKYPL